MVILNPTPQEKAEERKRLKAIKKSWFSHITTWTLRLSLVLVTIFAIILFTLSRIDGQDDEFRLSLEKHFEENTHYRVKIGALKKFSVLPNFHIDMTNVEFYDDRTKKQLLKFGALYTSASLFDLLRGTNKIKGLYIEELTLSPALTGAEALYIEEAYFQPPTKDAQSTGQTRFMAHANYAGTAFDFSADVNYERDGDGSYVYQIPVSAPVKLTWNYNELTFRHAYEDQQRHFNDIKLSVPDSEVPLVTGDVTLRNAGIHASLKSGEAEAKAVLKLGEATSGNIDITNLDLQELSKFSALLPQSSLKEEDTDTEAKIDLSGYNIQVTANIKDLKSGDLNIGSFRLPISVRNGEAHLRPLSGSILDGSLKGSLSYTPVRKDEKENFSSQLKIQKINLSALSEDIQSGHGDLDINLISMGDNPSVLLKNLDGIATFVGGEAQMPVSSLHVWGNGLVRALLPSIDPSEQTTVNCTIMDFAIEDGIAKTQNLFLDTKRMTVQGKGEISLIDQTAKIKLKPKSKDTAILKFDTAINVSGDLADPSISPDAASIGLTGLKALAGVINPAILLVTMSDMGLTENHPCHAFIPEQKKAHEERPEEKKQSKKEPAANE